MIARDHDDASALELVLHAVGSHLDDACVGVRSLVTIADWLPVNVIASVPSSRIAIDSIAMEMSFAGRQQHVELAPVGIGRNRLCQSEEIISRVAHRGNDDDHIEALRFRLHDASGHGTKSIHIGDARTPVFLDHDRHATRCQRQRGTDASGDLGLAIDELLIADC